ncbi:hypothetical protein GCM10027610_059510 [Dactylosporangium cerinum]
MTELLRIEDLRVRFAVDGGHVTAVDGLDLTVSAGEIVALVGESGSGKTATATAVLGLLPDTATVTGRILLRPADGSAPLDVLDVDARQLRRLRGTAAAMVFQEPSTALNPVYPVGWQIAEGLRAHGVGGRAARRARAVELLDAVGIPEPRTRVDHYPHQFSGGQRQRVVIAQALALDARLIVADEPTSALDVTVQAEILELLLRCRTDFGTGILLITHNMGVVADIADRVAVMHRGQIVEQAGVDALFATPAHAYTQELLAAIPVPGTTATRTPPAGEPIVAASQLVVEYPRQLGRGGTRAVDGVSFHIAEGEVLGLVGESGSGKTTIGRAVAGLTPVTGGTLDVRTPAGKLGYVFQDPATSFNPCSRSATASPSRCGCTAGTCPAPPPAGGSASCWSRSSCRPRTPGGTRTSSAAASGSGPAWPARSPWARACSSPTNRPPPWTCPSRPESWSCSCACTANSGSPPCSSATTWPSSRPSPTGSWSCSTASPWRPATPGRSCTSRCTRTPAA